ncbi:MAG: EAL domain-containing protein [Edaphobacter sp.]|uniref:EAL domain-containing protein n=1 Tax=Edaphobacter sp. TaxID=1934404 RepID=UPI00238869C5|nr:EAL domain-containing protein [Edaphobacter sp.]MDE1178815.1 EAL domain-containing protein [Edaphobacter sp.]
MTKTKTIDVLIDSGFLPQADGGPEFPGQLERVLSGDLVPEIYFQPIVDLRRGLVTGYEALTRFPKELNTAPDVFFQRAGRVGRRMELEHMVCKLVLQQRSRLPQGSFLTMNLGPDYLLSDLWEQLVANERDLAGMVIEITEETSISSYEAIRERSAQVRSMGGLVAVDDAGAGYASLQHILELRPDFIKLNRHFVKNCHLDRAKSTMIEMMVAAADRLDAWVIAEGVEIVQELEELIRTGVPLAQGFLLARPELELLGLSAQVAGELSRHSRMNREKTLEPHLMSCGLCLSVKAADDLLRYETEHTVAVVLDRFKRPQRMLERHPLLGVRLVESFMKSQVASSPRQVLYRALGRPSPQRFDPIVVVGNDGECMGVVSVDRLMSSVLTLDAQPLGA